MSENDNGILATIGGEHIAQAMRSLPPATPTSEDTLERIYDLGGRRIKLTFVKSRHKRAKSTHWFWTASKAVAVD